MNAAQVNSTPTAPKAAAPSLLDEALSALTDGELDAEQLPGLFSTLDQRQPEAMASWHAYQLIGDVLRGEPPVATKVAPVDFLAGVRARLQEEAAPARQIPSSKPAVQEIQPTSSTVSAANDPVFRWKLVAGLASLAAVMAVSWSVLSSVPRGVGGEASPQMAAAPAAVESAVVDASKSRDPVPAAVVVNTGQGTLIRDARLEQLLAEHRQNGGMSALQNPTGFIRNATYESEGR